MSAFNLNNNTIIAVLYSTQNVFKTSPQLILSSTTTSLCSKEKLQIQS